MLASWLVERLRGFCCCSCRWLEWSSGGCSPPEPVPGVVAHHHTPPPLLFFVCHPSNERCLLLSCRGGCSHTTGQGTQFS